MTRESTRPSKPLPIVTVNSSGMGFGRDWVLVSLDQPWENALARMGQELGVALSRASVAAEDRNTVRQAFGLDASGASLVRPDGFVAWRAQGMPENPHHALAAALRAVSHANRS